MLGQVCTDKDGGHSCLLSASNTLWLLMSETSSNESRSPGHCAAGIRMCLPRCFKDPAACLCPSITETGLGQKIHTTYQGASSKSHGTPVPIKQHQTDVDKVQTQTKAIRPSFRPSMDVDPAARNHGHPRCIQATDCKGTPESTLFRHIDEGRLGDLYCAECWAYCKQCYPNADIKGVEEASEKDPDDVKSEQQLGSGSNEAPMTNLAGG